MIWRQLVKPHNTSDPETPAYFVAAMELRKCKKLGIAIIIVLIYGIICTEQ